ncbi:MAG: methyltransferase [Rhodospirillales bacterium]|nr:MAG: methyltransferase [Rhodospirillales bacterium]
MTAADSTTDDAFLDGRLRLTQPARGYRAAIDAVLLAAAVELAPGQRALDVGCGVGTAALCLLARARASRIAGVSAMGLEVQRGVAALARLNGSGNGFEDAFTVVDGDVAAPPAALVGMVFDQILTNPPYLPPERADPSPDPAKALATVESSADLASWLAFCRDHLAPGGTLTLIHRADRLVEIERLLADGFGDIAIRPLAPRDGVAARRVLVRAGRGGSGPTSRLAPLVLHAPGGGFTPAVEAALRDAAPLAW